MENLDFYYLNGKIKTITDSTVLVELETGDTINWPKNKLSQNLNIGDQIKIFLNNIDSKTVINELLKTE